MVETSGLPRWGSFWLALAVGFGLKIAPAADKAIQDNSFLLEEAYNQERGVVQHISTFTRSWNSNDWCYSFTEEWPGLHNPRHQFSYTLTGVHAGAFTGIGLGDTALHYRYQWIGSGDTPLAIAPRFSVLVPSGSVEKGRGTGGAGVQLNVPASVVVSRLIVTHWNVTGTYFRHARDAARHRANSLGYGFGQSLVFLAHPRFNALLETSVGGFQDVIGGGKTEWTQTVYLSPGVRWAYNLGGVQIVPGVAVPLGLGPSRGTHSLFVYLSFEHAFR